MAVGRENMSIAVSRLLRSVTGHGSANPCWKVRLGNVYLKPPGLMWILCRSFCTWDPVSQSVNWTTQGFAHCSVRSCRISCRFRWAVAFPSAPPIPWRLVPQGHWSGGLDLKNLTNWDPNELDQVLFSPKKWDIPFDGDFKAQMMLRTIRFLSAYPASEKVHRMVAQPGLGKAIVQQLMWSSSLLPIDCWWSWSIKEI